MKRTEFLRSLFMLPAIPLLNNKTRPIKKEVINPTNNTCSSYSISDLGATSTVYIMANNEWKKFV